MAEAPKGKRGGAATKAPPKTAPAAVVDKVETSSFPAKTLDKLRRLLEEERETYLRQAHDLAAEAEALAAEREPGDTQFDEESGEGDTLNVERERDLALSASATQAGEGPKGLSSCFHAKKARSRSSPAHPRLRWARARMATRSAAVAGRTT